MYADMLADGRVARGRRTKPGLSPRSVGHAHRILGRALRMAEESGLVVRNVCRLVHPPRVPHAEMATVTAEQARALIQAAKGGPMHALYTLALSSGARRGELLGLRWSDVDMDVGAIRITRTLVRGVRAGEREADDPPKVEWSFAEPKTASSRRTITIGRTALGALRLHRKAQIKERVRIGQAWQDGDLVFPTTFGTPIDGSNLLKAHYALLKQTGLPRVRWHDLRHSAATLLLEAGVQPHAVAQRLGHATPSLVMNTYGHVTDRMQQQATAAMDAALTG
jgi:integrase